MTDREFEQLIEKEGVKRAGRILKRMCREKLNITRDGELCKYIPRARDPQFHVHSSTLSSASYTPSLLQNMVNKILNCDNPVRLKSPGEGDIKKSTIVHHTDDVYVWEQIDALEKKELLYLIKYPDHAKLIKAVTQHINSDIWDQELMDAFKVHLRVRRERA